MDRSRHAATWVKLPAAGPSRGRPGTTTAGSALSTNTALALGGCALLAVMAPFLLFLAAYFCFQAFGLVYPGVKVGSTSLGGLTVKQSQQTLDKSWNQRLLVASDGQKFWPADPLDFGLWLDPQATAQSAYAIGRGSNGGSQLFSILTFHAPSVNPVVQFDPDFARLKLKSWAATVQQPAKDASLTYQNGQWQAVPGQNGSTLDIDATLAEISANPTLVMTSGYVPLKMKPVAPTVSDLSPILDKLNGLLSRPLKINVYDAISDKTIKANIPPETLAPWVLVQNPTGDPLITIDPNQFLKYLTTWQPAGLGSGKTIQPPENLDALTDTWQSGQSFSVFVHYQPTQYVLQPGDTLLSISFDQQMMAWKILQANPGLDANKLYAGQTLTIPSKNDLLPLPVVPNKRIVISITQQRLWTYQNGSLLKEYVISTGIAKSPTQPGVFQVQSHVPNAYASIWDLYMPNFLGIYEASPGFMNGIHGLPMLSSGVRLWGSVLGKPASFGCIIMTLADAQTVYNWADDGVVVVVQP
ncbi:MAG TPA: L,D-transpeptidase family protein [Anaerolineaceae bacterium]|nr:L,D-transpeptidase family protein [Anaerolineaceae bacterium]